MASQLRGLSVEDGDRISSFAGQSLFTENGRLGVHSDQGPWYEHTNNTKTELTDTPVPCAAVEVVSPDDTETTVVTYRDGTEQHGYDGGAYITFKQSRDGGETVSDIATVKLSSTIDPSRTGNGLIALDDKTIFFFDSQVGPNTRSNEATAVHRLDWNSVTRNWEVTTNLNRYRNYRILAHFEADGLLHVGYIDFTRNPQVVTFAEFDPASNRLTDVGIINEQLIRPNEHVIQQQSDGTLVAIIRCEAPDIETSGPVEQWCTCDDGGETWTNEGYIQQTLHPASDSYGATKGGQMIDTPYGERLVFLYRWGWGNARTILGLFNPYKGIIEQNMLISTVESNEGANGGLRLVEHNDEGRRFYVVHEQGNRGDASDGSGVFFRDLTLYQPAIYREHYEGGGTSNEDEARSPGDPVVAGNREYTWVSVSKSGSQVGARVHLGSSQDVARNSEVQVTIDTVQFNGGIDFDPENNALVIRESESLMLTRR